MDEAMNGGVLVCSSSFFQLFSWLGPSAKVFLSAPNDWRKTNLSAIPFRFTLYLYIFGTITIRHQQLGLGRIPSLVFSQREFWSALEKTIFPMPLSKPSPLINPFVLVKSSPGLDHLIRLLSTWGGTDKVFMLLQYGFMLVAWALRRRRRNYPMLKPFKTAEALSKFVAVVADARVLYRIWGLLPIFQWMSSLERAESRPPTKALLNIERLQGWSMLLYYPLEHICYLASKGVVAVRPQQLNKMSIWSCRFWASYVGLQILHLSEDFKLLSQQRRQLQSESSHAVRIEGLRLLKEKRDALVNETIVNLGYLPLTVHWSLEKGFFANSVWVGFFGTLAAIAQLRAGWKATY